MKGNVYTYSDLVTAWKCPRAWSWYAQGYRQPLMPEAYLRGIFTHKAVAAHWMGQRPMDAIEVAYADYLEGVKSMRAENADALKDAGRAKAVAEDLAARYISKFGESVAPAAVEELMSVPRSADAFETLRIGGTPDLVAIKPNSQRVLVNFKTTGNMYLKALDVTGQYDFYAYVWGETGRKPINAILFDVVSPEYITRVERPPRLERGRYLFEAARELSGMSLTWSQALPHFGHHCGSCEYMAPCSLYEDGGDPQERLMAEYAIDEASIGRYAAHPDPAEQIAAKATVKATSKPTFSARPLAAMKDTL